MARGQNESLAGVERVRAARVRAARDLTMGREMDWALRDLAKQRRSVTGCGAAWNAVVPEEVGRKASLEGLVRGVLTVRVPDAATNFALQRFLRGGGERALIGAAKAAISKVRVVVGDGEVRR